ncbi:hypothetical protein NDU88_002788 [Pleurodeles waltl]|uniref:Uncharacterized protein n=1 Tax=Pleurodeles waltl TaxID=8319 RepID=A0AAV7L019_PLEWA|nr:hypothetical protein NDU88_002788 [Pleurodeles waltl]
MEQGRLQHTSRLCLIRVRHAQTGHIRTRPPCLDSCTATPASGHSIRVPLASPPFASTSRMAHRDVTPQISRSPTGTGPSAAAGGWLLTSSVGRVSVAAHLLRF